MRFSQAKVALGVAALATMLAFGTTANAAPVSKCNAAKKKCIGKYIAAVMGCHAKAEGKSLMVDSTCLSKATAKITGGGKGCFDKSDAKNDACSVTGDASAQLALADAFILDVVNDIDPNYPTPHTNKCDAGQKKCVGKKASGLMGCKAKENKDGVGDPACEPKIQGKFSNVDLKGCFDKLVIKNDGPCDGASAAAVELKVDQWADDSADALDIPPVATPTPTATSTPAGPLCGNGVNDPGEACDPNSAPNTWAQCGADFTCTVGCNCACPNTVVFSGDANDPNSILDTGFSGISHRSPIITNGDVTIDLNCAATERPCGICPVTGPVVNPQAGTGQLDNRRCSSDSSLKCSVDATCTAAANKCSGGTNNGAACTVQTCGLGTCNGSGVCVGGGTPGAACCAGGFCRTTGTCNYYFGSALPLAAGGISTCVVNQFKQAISGTANVETGYASTTAFLTARVYNGISVDTPCPQCLGDSSINVTATTGVCDAGPRQGFACDANGSVPDRPDFGTTSLDCPPNPGGIIATLTIDLSSKTDTVVKTLTTGSPNCAGLANNKCLCDTCNNANADACDENSDCSDPPGPVYGPICGGRRCLSGVNVGAACLVASECPGSSCGKPGQATTPSGCTDNTLVYGSPNNHFDCSDPDMDGVGRCEAGPDDGQCSVASGHAQRQCTSDAECGGGFLSCESVPRACFLTGGGTFNALAEQGSNTLIAVGMADVPMGDVSNPTLGAVFCVGPTSASAINNVAGLPGPSRITIRGTAVGHPAP